MPKVFQYNEATVILLGTDAKDSIELVSKAEPTSWWIHLDIVPSGHIVIQNDQSDDQPDDKIIDFAAHICLKHVSQKKQSSSLYYKNNVQCFDIVMTKISNLIYNKNYLNLGEVEFKSTSKRKLLKLSIPLKNDI